MPSDKKLIDPADFHSLKLLTTFQNTSTGLKEISSEQCALIEIGVKTLVVELPAQSCNKSHNVILNVSVQESGLKIRKILAVTGKVIQIEDGTSRIGENETKKSRVTIDCIQFDEQSWKELIKLYSNRQDAITNFLKAAKGY